MRTLLLGARGAVGSVVRDQLLRAGHDVTRAGRTAEADAVIDLHGGDLDALSTLTEEHDVVVNASGVERVDLARATGRTPLIEISATGSYLDALRSVAPEHAVVLGAGLIPGLSTVMVQSLRADTGDEVDVLVMLGSGEHHGPAAVDWTANLVGTDVYAHPEDERVRNLTTSVRATGPDGRTRRYLRADFPDHVLVGGTNGPRIRAYLTLSSAPMTLALGLVGRLPALRGAMASSPHLGSADWHLLVRNRRTSEQRHARGTGQSEATGRLTALAAIRAAQNTPPGPVTMADLVTLDEALEVLD